MARPPESPVTSLVCSANATQQWRHQGDGTPAAQSMAFYQIQVRLILVVVALCGVLCYSLPGFTYTVLLPNIHMPMDPSDMQTR